MDTLIIGLDKAMKVIFGLSFSRRPSPADRIADDELTLDERRHSAGLMRVNHVGEVCAQALYDAQGRYSNAVAVQKQFENAAHEEEDHLAWTTQRLRELGSRPSLFNPVWYLGAYAIGTAAARMGDPNSLGFVVETERQVEAHLAGHLQSLSSKDAKSRAIVEQMRLDEMTHGATAYSLGAREVPEPIKKAMKVMAKVMTTTAYYL